jgi:outer membrane protein TolC
LKKRYIFHLIAVFIVLQACAPVGYDFHAPRIRPPAEWQKNKPKDDDALRTWWRRFDDPVLDALVARALRDNLDLHAAGARILQSRATLGIAAGYTYPQLQQLSADTAAVYRGNRRFDTASIAFDVAWEADIWGKYARMRESAEAALLASVASYRDIARSVVAETARQYIIYRTAQERLVYAYRNAAIQSRIVRMTEVQFNSGNVSELDMQQARAQLHATRAAVWAIRQDMVRARNALALLIGADPFETKRLLRNAHIAKRIAQSEKLQHETKSILLPESSRAVLDVDFIPHITLSPELHLDASLLSRRPDIKAAEHLAHAAAAQTGIAQADLYPSFSLFGSLSYTPGDTFGSWINGREALGVSAGPSLRWNIFNYGRIKNAVRLKDALFEERLAAYNKTVLKALGEVSNAAEGYRLLGRQIAENTRALKAVLRAFNLSATQYNDGLVGYQRLLTSVEQLTRTQDLHAQLRGLRAQQAVLFFKAIGGGWQATNGKRYLPSSRTDAMRKRTDWDEMLDDKAMRLPGGKR